MVPTKEELESTEAPPTEDLTSRVRTHAGANFGPTSDPSDFDPIGFVGMPLQAAIEAAKSKGFRVRLSGNDGEPYSLEPRPNDKKLLTFEVSEGLVTSAGAN